LEKYDWLRERLLETEGGRRKLEKVKELATIADEAGIPMPQFALAWCLKNKNVSTVITGASKAAQVEQNMKAIEVVDQLTPSVMEHIEGVLDNKPRAESNFRNNS
jgi:aryl-alcohol dehydrogenase-like predicted oxidoreductase